MVECDLDNGSLPTPLNFLSYDWRGAWGALVNWMAVMKCLMALIQKIRVRQSCLVAIVSTIELLTGPGL